GGPAPTAHPCDGRSPSRHPSVRHLPGLARHPPPCRRAGGETRTVRGAPRPHRPSPTRRRRRPPSRGGPHMTLPAEALDHLARSVLLALCRRLVTDRLDIVEPGATHRFGDDWPDEL